MTSAVLGLVLGSPEQEAWSPSVARATKIMKGLKLLSVLAWVQRTESEPCLVQGCTVPCSPASSKSPCLHVLISELDFKILHFTFIITPHSLLQMLPDEPQVIV